MPDPSGHESDHERERDLLWERDGARGREAARERHLPSGEEPVPTAERFLPPRRTGRAAERAGPGDGWYASGEEAELLARRGGPDRESEGTGWRRPSTAAEPPAEKDPGPSGGEAVSGPQEGTEGVSGPDLARAVLDAALAKRQQYQRTPRRRSGAGVEGNGRRPRGYSGPGPDPRDPQPFGKVLERLMRARGWEKPKAEATVFGAWERVVGEEIARHSRPVKLESGVLTVEAESTAWATQLRLLAATLLRNIASEVGHNVVTRLNIHGPAAPSWSKGPRRVQGRGPRDTYG